MHEPEPPPRVHDLCGGLAEVTSVTGQTLDELLRSARGHKGNPATWLAAWTLVFLAQRRGKSHHQPMSVAKRKTVETNSEGTDPRTDALKRAAVDDEPNTNGDRIAAEKAKRAKKWTPASEVYRDVFGDGK